MAKSKTPIPLDFALGYIAKNWPVIPLHNPVKAGGCSCGVTDCSSIGKHPRTEHGLKDAATEKDQATRWWGRWPHANIGITTGKGSGLIVIDIDPQNGGDIGLEELEDEHGKLPDTVEVLTGGGGRHFYFEHPGDSEYKNATGIYPGVDVKADGGYVVAPPSIHASGNRYEFEISSHPSLDEVDIALCPKWLISLLQKTNYVNIADSMTDSEVIPKGERNETLFRIAASLRAQEHGLDYITDYLIKINTHQIPTGRWCEEPLPDTELERIAHSVFKYPPGAKQEIEPEDTDTESTFPLLTLDDIYEFEDPSFLIDELLVEGTITLLGGFTGVGKSIVALSFIRSVLTGQSLWDKYKVNKTGPVLLIDEETPQSFLKERVSKMEFERHLPLYCLHFQDVRLDIASQFNKLVRTIDQVKPVLVVIDSLIRVHSKMEDTAWEMAEVMQRLRKLANQDMTLLILHHHRKGGGNIRERLRGSSDIPGGVDVEYAIVEKDEYLNFQSVKTRIKPLPTIRLQINAEDDTIDVSYEGTDQTALEDVQLAICSALLEGGEMTRQEIEDRLRNDGITASESTIYLAIRDLVGPTLIERTGEKRRKYYSMKAKF